MIAESQTQKLTHLFKLLDKDNNGVLQEKDFLFVGENIASFLDLNKEEKRYQHIMEQCKFIYHTIFQYIPHHSEGEDAISMSIWLFYFDFALNDEDNEIIDSIVDLFINQVFDLFDQNRDGYINQREYIDMFKIYGLNMIYEPHGFKALDTNKDNKISKEELQNGLRDFFLSVDPNSSGNWTFGKWEA
jgi:Ca2+-binding EF-hand superfamily protein